MLSHDLPIALRKLLKSPGFTVMSTLVIALGIGVNVALFTVVQSVLLRPLPFRDPNQLIRLYEKTLGDKYPFNGNAAGVFAQWRKQSNSFSGLGIYGDIRRNLSGTQGQLPETVRAAVFSWNMMPLLGIQPALGRNFTEGDDQPSANGTVILSWGLWKRRFGASPSVLNQTVLLDAKPYTVIGVMPASFTFPSAALQLWTLIYHDEPVEEMRALDSHDFEVIGRLKPGVTQTAALAELSLITQRLHNDNPDDPFVSAGANARPLLDSIVGDVTTPLYILLGATGCVLLIACLNVANLLVARSMVGRRELAIRTALGCSHVKLLCQNLTESFLLTGAGGAMGLLLARSIVQWFVKIRRDVPRVEAIHLDAITVSFALGLVTLSAIFATLISSFSSRSDQVLASLQESSRSYTAGHTRTRLRKILLSLQVGATVVLLIGSGLLLKSYAKLRSTDVGCITKDVLTMKFTLPEAHYNKTSTFEFFETLLARVRNYPGVQDAGLISPLVPADGYGGDNGFTIVGHAPLPPGHGQTAIHRWVDPGYFAAIGIPFTSGHTFDESQQPGHATQVIISDSFRWQYFAGQNPIGQHLMTWGNRPYEIVGIVGDTRFDAAEQPQPMMYFPLFASPSPFAQDFINDAVLVVHSRGDTLRLALPVQKIFQQLDRDLPVSDILTMDQVIGRQMLDRSFDAALLLIFALVSLILAAVGLFGVLSYLVAQRTTEIGIRIALGAQRHEVIRLMLIDGLRPALFGLGLGVVSSAVVTRIIQSMLYGTEPVDPSVFGAAACILLLVATLACWFPAWRASRVDPMQTLRAE